MQSDSFRRVPAFRNANPALRVIALVFSGQWLILQLIFTFSEGFDFAERFWLGNDFAYLYNAAGYYLSGQSPYRETNFIPLPPALYLPMLVHRLSYWDAFTAYRIINFCLVVAAMLWLCRQLRLGSLNTALMLLITITYGPFYQLLTGGNLDGLMLVFLIFSCTLSVSGRGSFLALSVGTKFYSLLLIPIFAIRGRWRDLCWAALALAVLLAPFVRYLPDAFASVFHRTSVLRLDGNESPAVLFILLFGAKRAWAWRTCYAALWGGTLLARLIVDGRHQCNPEEERFKALDYLPWMAAAPVLVFTYTSTILLAWVGRLAFQTRQRSVSSAEWISVAGVLLLGTYSFLYRQALALLAPRLNDASLSTFSLVIAPVGLTAILLGSSLAARTELAVDPAPQSGGSV